MSTNQKIARGPSSLGRALVALLLLSGVAGCDASESEDDDQGAVFSVEALKSAYDAAWTAKDPAAFAVLYAEDADFVAPIGVVSSGREAIRAQHAFLFSGPFAGSTGTTSVRRTMALTETTAMVDLDVTLTGYRGLPPGLPEVQPGVVRTRIKWIVVERAGRWEILAQQMTALPPA